MRMRVCRVRRVDWLDGSDALNIPSSTKTRGRLAGPEWHTVIDSDSVGVQRRDARDVP